MKKLILILALFLAGMAAFAQDMKTYQYAERDTLILYLDFYTPETVHDSTICLVYVFGGGFIGGHRDGKWEKAYFKQLVDEGFMVASIDYRLGLKGAKNLGLLNTEPLEKAVYMATECDFGFGLSARTCQRVENQQGLYRDDWLKRGCHHFIAGGLCVVQRLPQLRHTSFGFPLGGCGELRGCHLLEGGQGAVSQPRACPDHDVSRNAG